MSQPTPPPLAPTSTHPPVPPAPPQQVRTYPATSQQPHPVSAPQPTIPQLLSDQLRAQPLTELPEPQLIEENGEPLLPSEILAESTRALHNQAAIRIYPWVTVIGGLFWVLFIGVVLAAGNPLLMMAGAFLATFAPMDVAGPIFAVLMVATAGLVLSVGMIPLGVFWASRIRPRELLSETVFQRTIAQRIALAFSAPMALACLVIAALFASSPLMELPSYWYTSSWFILPNLFLPGLTTLLMFWTVRGVLRASNPFGLPTVTQLLTAVAQAPTATEATRLLSIVHAQDRRHLPPNTPRLNGRVLARSTLQVAKTAVPLLLMAAPGVTVIVQLMSVLAPPPAGTSLGIPAADIVGASLPWWVLPAVIGLSIGWLALAGPIPATVMALLRPKPGQVRDLRTYTTPAERYQVNDWERSVVHLSNLLIQIVTMGATIGFALIAVGGGASVVAMVTALFMFWFTVQPINAIFTHAIIGGNLRQIVYGPAGQFMRRRTPIGAITLLGMTRSAYANQPDVRAATRMAEPTASAPTGPSAAAGVRPAPADSSGYASGDPAAAQQAPPVIALPDFGASQSNRYSEFTVHQPAERDDYTIPDDLDSLASEPSGRRWFRRNRG